MVSRDALAFEINSWVILLLKKGPMFDSQIDLCDIVLCVLLILALLEVSLSYCYHERNT